MIQEETIASQATEIASQANRSAVQAATITSLQANATVQAAEIARQVNQSASSSF